MPNDVEQLDPDREGPLVLGPIVIGRLETGEGDDRQTKGVEELYRTPASLNVFITRQRRDPTVKNRIDRGAIGGVVTELDGARIDWFQQAVAV